MSGITRSSLSYRGETDKWKHTFAYFWYDEPHIFEWKQADFDRAMKDYTDTGINHIIGFSITHIRWSFYPWWDIINKTIEKMVKACHKNNIFYTEHHSAMLHFCPDTPERLAFIEKRFFGKRKGSYHNWAGFQEKCLGDIIIDGRNFKEMFQIDPASGKPYVYEEYGTSVVCPNNPDLLPIYLSYLATLYKLGIDGIMTDDVHMYSSINDTLAVCACPACQEKYARVTGYHLPSTGDELKEFNAKVNTPEYSAMVRFREESLLGFHRRVKEHYESLALHPFRPNYSATTLYWSNPGQYCLDLLPALDWVMIENTFEHIIRYSWPEWIIEHNHRFALARHRHLPAAAMFYPHQKDQVEFCWALAQSSGLKYLGTANCKPIDLNPWEKPLREFEEEHESSILHTEKTARTAFYFSRSTRDLYDKYNERTRVNSTAWMLACELGNIPYDMILPEELNDLSRFGVIVLNEAFVMSDTEIESFQRFVADGGRIIWVGENAVSDENFRITRTFKNIWGFDRSPGWNSHGKGQVSALQLEEWSCPLRRRVLGPLHMVKDDEPNYQYEAPDVEEHKRYDTIGCFVRDALTEPDMLLENAPIGLLCHVCAPEKRDHLVLHLLNAAGTLEKPESGYVMHRDALPFPKMMGTMTARVRMPDGMLSDHPCAAEMHRPGESSIVLSVSYVDRSLYVHVPLELIRFYGLVTIGKADGNA